MTSPYRTSALGLAVMLFLAAPSVAQCVVRIDPVAVAATGSGAFGPITVTGTGNGCEQVKVELACLNRVTSPLVTVNNSTWAWTWTFTNADVTTAGCSCSVKRITISADGLYKNIVRDTKQVIPTVTGCGACGTPTLTPIPPKCTDRRPDGTWPVAFKPGSTGTTVFTSYTIFWGDDTPVETNITPDLTTGLITHVYRCPYSSPAYNVGFTASGCGTTVAGSTPVSVDFPECPCPVINPIQATVDGCNVHLSVTTAGCTGNVTSYVWSLGDTHAKTTEGPSADYAYAHNGTYAVNVTLIGAGDSCSPLSPTSVSITNCGGTHNGKPDDGGKCKGLIGRLRCMKFPCWALGILVALAVAGFLVAVATGFGSFTAPVIGTVSLSELLTSIMGAVLLLMAAACGLCPVATATLAGVVLGLIIIVLMAYYSGSSSVPNWPAALVWAIVLAAAAAVVMKLEC